MKLEGGCYCGKVRYVAEGKPMLKAQCHCRECQYISGGAPNVFLLMPRWEHHYGARWRDVRASTCQPFGVSRSRALERALWSRCANRSTKCLTEPSPVTNSE